MEITTHARLRSRTLKRADAQADMRPRTTLSFYRYVHIENPEAFRLELLETLTKLECYGRIYVACEGINAQMTVLSKDFALFDDWIQSKPELAGVPYKCAVEEGLVRSFYKLTIKIKDKIVADGLDDSLFDTSNTGAYLSAAELNEYIDNPDALVVDVRNNYESEVGHFEGAIVSTVPTFKDELKSLPELLRIHKHKKIALYCTGGIRCEKASAWLKHNGFDDVRHLKGGIIEYAHQIKAQNLSNRFRGKNFVFDERMSESVGHEIIATCHLCRVVACDTHHHCKNAVCNVLHIGCATCVVERQGYCSGRCRLFDTLPENQKKLFARYFNRYIRKRMKFAKTRLARV